MKDDDKDRKDLGTPPGITPDDQGDDDATGYCKPPKKTRFQEGKSGNPSGRPRGRKSLAEIMAKVAATKVTVRDGSKTKQVPALEVVFRKAVAQAVAGDHRARTFVLQLMRQFTDIEERRKGSRRGPDEEVWVSFLERIKDKK